MVDFEFYCSLSFVILRLASELHSRGWQASFAGDLQDTSPGPPAWNPALCWLREWLPRASVPVGQSERPSNLWCRVALLYPARQAEWMLPSYDVCCLRGFFHLWCACTNKKRNGSKWNIDDEGETRPGYWIVTTNGTVEIFFFAEKTKARFLSINPFTPKSEWSMSHFPCSFSRNITSHNMEIWFFITYSDERWFYYQLSLPYLCFSL